MIARPLLPEIAVALTRGLVRTSLVVYATSEREYVLVELARERPELCYYPAPRPHCTRGVWYLELSDDGVALAEGLASEFADAWSGLCEYERGVLLGAHDGRWGAAIGQAVEVLRSRGLYETPRGAMLRAWAEAGARP